MSTFHRPDGPEIDGQTSEADELIAVLSERTIDPSRRRLAAVAPGKRKDTAAVEALIVAIDDRPDVAVATIDALAITGDARAVEPLVGSLHSKTFSVREHAITALGRIGGEKAIEPLIERTIAGEISAPYCGRYMYK